MLDDNFEFENTGTLLPNPKWPIGHYSAFIHPHNSKYTKSKKGLACIRWELHIIGPAHRDCVVYKWSMLEGAGVGFTKADFLILGHTVKNKWDVKIAFANLKSACVNIKIDESEELNKKKVHFISLCKPDEIDMGPHEYLQEMYWK